LSAITVVGGGLAGAEAAWQITRRGTRVELYEMRPQKYTPAHHTAQLAELVCSNSLRAAALENAVGLLKEELRRLDSLIMACADKHQVPAGGALAVDRESFAACVTSTLLNHPLVSVQRREITTILPDRPLVIATGPLTAEKLAGELQKLLGESCLYFFDAAAPIVTADSIDYTKVFRASRYDKGGDSAYLNCPMDREQYQTFYQALITAQTHQLHGFEGREVFEACLPVEVMALRGEDTLRFGPLKPVGLVDPHTGQEPYAVVQLRQDDAAGSLYNLVGFQTNLRWPEQERVFRLIPGLEGAQFVRLGVMHRNTYINSPRVLSATTELKENAGIFLAGQLTGVEGYVESTASGLAAGINAWLRLMGQETVRFPTDTAIGALLNYLENGPANFQPMNVNFGLFPPLEGKIKGKSAKKQFMARRALESLAYFRKQTAI